MKRNFKKISLSLIITIILSVFHSGVLVEAKSNAQTTSNNKSNNMQIKKYEAKILQEIVDKRQSNVKYFLKDDGSYEAVIYYSPIHYLENGKWKDIDNTLIDNKNEIVNSKNDFKVRLSKNNDNNLVTISKDNYEIAWNLVGGNIQNGTIQSMDKSKVDEQINNSVNEVISNKKKLENLTDEDIESLKKIIDENERKKLLTKTQSSIKYSNVFDNIDLQYVLANESIKENIIINKQTNIFEYKFKFSMKNIDAKLNSDNSITFFDKKDSSKIVFHLDSPYMYDAKGVKSNEIKVDLEKENNGYILSFSPNQDWVNSSNRVFPITIDPDVSAITTYRGTGSMSIY